MKLTILFLTFFMTLPALAQKTCRYSVHQSLIGQTDVRSNLKKVEKILTKRGFEFVHSSENADVTILDLDAFCEDFDFNQSCKKAYGTIRLFYPKLKESKSYIKIIQPYLFYTNTDEALEKVINQIKGC